MKHLLCLLSLSLMIAFSPKAVAASHSEVSPSGHTIYYEIINGKAKVVPSIGVANHNLSTPRYNITGNVIIPDSITYNGIKRPVTAIDDYAFCCCTTIVTMTLPNTLETIGVRAFYYCYSMTAIFNLNNVSTIGDYAFGKCSSLMSINMGDSILSLGNSAFQECTSLSSITIPNGITTLGLSLFEDCHNLSTIVIPSNVNTIGQFVFGNCFSLSSITLPDSLSIIDSYAFVNCTTLTSIEIPASVTSISSTSFLGCVSLSSIIVSPNNLFYDSRQNCNAIIETATNKLVRACINTQIPEGIVSIGDYSLNYYVYRNNDYLGFTSAIPSSVIIPSTVTSVGYNALYEYDKVFFKSILPPSINGSVPSNTFYYVPCESTDQYWISLGSYAIVIPKGPYYNMNVSPDNSSYGYCSVVTSDIDRPIDCDSNAIISATPYYGYHFVMWSNGSTKVQDTLFITNDTTITAFFSKNNYYVIGNPNVAIRGVVNGSDTVEYLDTVMLEAISSYGYHFTRWSDYSTENPYSIVANENKSLTAIFDFNQYTISLNVDSNVHGIVSGNGNYDYLSERIISATPNYGYHFTMWNDGDTNNPRTLTLTQDTSFTALFERNSYVVSTLSNNPVMGFAEGGDTALFLDSITIIATPNYGYHFAQWNDNNISNPRVVQVTGNHTYIAQFGHNQYSITLNVDTNIHGTVVGDGSYNYLSEQTITATASYGYHFTAWSDGDTNNPRIITLTQDTLFTALFEKNTYTITAISADNLKGTVTGSSPIEYLDSVTIMATPNYGYHFTGWNDGNADNPRTIVATRDSSFTASFGHNQYTITLNVDTNIHGSVIGSGSYNYLSEQTIIAMDNYGYHFTAWSDGITSNPRIITLTQDTVFTALFAKNQYTLTLQSNDEAHGSVIGGGVFDYLETVAIEAESVEHYHFVYWSDGNTDNPRQYVITGDDTLVATFAIDTHHVNVESCNIAFGGVVGSGDFEYGAPATVTATAYSGYQFVRWSNGDTHNPYTFAVLQDTTLIAIFEDETQGISDVIPDVAVNVYTLGNQIFVETNLKDEIGIYDIVGRKVDGGRKSRFEVHASGVYFVKIGSLPMQKVVVVCN